MYLQGDDSSFYLADEILSTNEYPQVIWGEYLFWQIHSVIAWIKRQGRQINGLW